MTRTLTPVVSVSSDTLFQTLDGIEKAPRMYGDIRAVEGLYFLILSLLAGPGDEHQVRELFIKASSRLAGHSTVNDLSTYVITINQMVEHLQEIRKELFNK